MKRYVALFVLSFLVLSCTGAPPAPPWLSTAVSRLEQFKSEYLGGRMDVAEMNFHLALAEIKKSGDMEILGRAYLTKMALEVALLRPGKDDDFVNLNKLFPSARNASYYAFLQGRWGEVDANLLPGAYAKFVNAATRGEGKIASLIGEIKDPLSRLIACGIYTSSKGADEEVLKIGAETASGQGWKRALVTYLERLASHYEKAGRENEAKKLRDRLSIIGP